MRRRWSTVVGIVLLVSLPLPARAGGALLSFDRDFYVPGDAVHAESGVWLESSMGRLEDGPYFAYVSTFTGLEKMPPPLPHDAIRVASVEVVPRPSGEHGVASVDFVLPRLEPGRYWLTICDEGCSITLGDILPTPMLVAADDEDGRLRALEQELSEDVRDVRIELRTLVLGHHPDALRQRVTAVERDVRRLAAEVNHLNALVGDGPVQSAREDRSSGLSPLLAFVVPAAVAGALFGRRTRASR